ncbi:GHKL domain-containing protein [Emticicia sp. C21]|nr:GHKL domain-containing protein [Emticicia sp. C21]
MVIGGMFCYIFNWNLPWAIESWPPFLLLFVDFIRVSIIADRRKDSNAKVPIYSLIVVAVCAAIAIIFLMIEGSTGTGTDSLILNLGIFLIIIMFFSIPIGLSLSLVREYTRTHQALSNKLIEIEKLSAKNLAHEQEKQQILAAQNEVLEKQVAERTAELAKSLEELKATQTQLIQSEKLASLGELTAGIAHEIQNPLNFVNNFSELSKELIEELEEERSKEKAERDEGLEEELLGDIAQNLEKINHHGKRASSIVKGMLEHSRASSGKKEPTDVNALADEYLRLAYHGIRAKDKSFNADFKANLDESLPKIPLITQDFGRVLLNLINNAFYAVKDMQGKGQVMVSTKKLSDQVEIKVSDNGTGIPDHVKAKIFQPFFTTKPTGQGTGLGLSLAYDIVTKGHGGTLDVETKEGEGTTFIIKLPYL